MWKQIILCVALVSLCSCGSVNVTDKELDEAIKACANNDGIDRLRTTSGMTEQASNVTVICKNGARFYIRGK